MATTTKNLLCRLTQGELDERIKELGQVCGELKRMESTRDHLREDLKHTKITIKELEQAQRGLADTIGSGHDVRPVPCSLSFSECKERVVFSRLDTGEVVEERNATPDELAAARQGQLFAAED